MTIEEIIAEIKAIKADYAGDVTSPQTGLIQHLTRDALFDCHWDDNPIVETIWGDCRVSELSKADASRFIDHFGRKTDDGWEVQRIEQMAALWHEFMKRQGQQELF